jgi:Flp pilus assembly protein TadG
MSTAHAQRGATSSETAIIMMVLLGFTFGIVDFGRALYTYDFVANLAREGARWAIVRGPNCTLYAPGLDHCPAQSSDVQTYVQSLSEGATPGTIDATLNLNGTCSTGTSGGCTAKVTVSYQFAFIAPFVSTLEIPMTSTSTMDVW